MRCVLSFPKKIDEVNDSGHGMVPIMDATKGLEQGDFDRIYLTM